MDEQLPPDLPGVVWPSSIFRPPTGQALVYLDLNHFINLARAASGLPTLPGYAELLTAAREAVSADHARFVLSAVHYREMSAIKDPRQRADVAAVMEQLTGFATLLSRTNITELEMGAALAVMLNRPPPTLGFPLVGHGVRFAFGLRDGFTIRDDQGNDVTDEARAAVGEQKWAELVYAADTGMERQALRGPSDSEAELLRATTAYRPETLSEGNEKRAQQERDQAQRLDEDPRWRRGRLRDVVAARELAMEWLDQFNAAIGPDFEAVHAFMSDRRNARWFQNCMPSSRVAITMKTRFHRDPQHRWTSNDLNDIDAMATAIPYCDAVFTDAAARSTLIAEKEHDMFGTFLPRRPQELTDWLARLPQRSATECDADRSAAGDRGDPVSAACPRG